jgi:hypothetical protein
VVQGNEEWFKVMKKLAEGWVQPFRECVLSTPEKGMIVTAIILEDFGSNKGLWGNMDGKVTLVGNAAHIMNMCKPLRHFPIPILIFALNSKRYINTETPITMIRGEGAKHGITDFPLLLRVSYPH